MTSEEQRIRELELEVARLNGEVAGLKLGLEATALQCRSCRIVKRGRHEDHEPAPVGARSRLVMDRVSDWDHPTDEHLYAR
jgi:hypothetical protein